MNNESDSFLCDSLSCTSITRRFSPATTCEICCLSLQIEVCSPTTSPGYMTVPLKMSVKQYIELLCNEIHNICNFLFEPSLHIEIWFECLSCIILSNAQSFNCTQEILRLTGNLGWYNDTCTNLTIFRWNSTGNAKLNMIMAIFD